jgi:hypothetical protein
VRAAYRSLIAFIAVTLLAVSPVFGQVDTGTIQGTVQLGEVLLLAHLKLSPTVAEVERQFR